MSIKLFIEALMKYISGVILTGVLIFLPAGTMFFPNGILFMALLFIPMFFAGIVLMVKNPELLKKRLDIKEKQKEQDVLIKLCAVLFVLGFVAAGIDFRFSFLRVNIAVSLVFSLIFLFAYLMYAMVLFQNKYLSRTIRAEEDQTVVDTGLYGIVRHPMYAASIILFLSVPFVLGSLVALPFFLLYPFIIAKRIKHEEAFLEKALCGYKEYKSKVKYRLIPFIW